MIHAKIDVKLHSHPKARKAGSAMATWAWALCYIRDHETDGFISDAMIGAAWPGEVQARKDAARLVAVGLWEVVADGSGPDGDGGWRLSKYADKNETRAEIDVRRAEDRGRKRKVPLTSADVPSGIRVESNRKVPNEHGDSVVGIPGSGSGSGSGSVDLESRSEDPTSSPRATAEPANDHGPPAWWEAALATVSAAVLGGKPIDMPGARWLEYLESVERRHMAPSQRHAVSWLSQVTRRELRDAPKRKPSDTRQPQLGPEPQWAINARTGTGGTEPF